MGGSGGEEGEGGIKRRGGQAESRSPPIRSPQGPPRRHGRDGHHGLNASEGEEASASNQFRGRVGARFAQAAPDASGGVQGALTHVRSPGRARSRGVSQAK